MTQNPYTYSSSSDLCTPSAHELNHKSMMSPLQISWWLLGPFKLADKHFVTWVGRYVNCVYSCCRYCHAKVCSPSKNWLQKCWVYQTRGTWSRSNLVTRSVPPEANSGCQRWVRGPIYCIMSEFVLRWNALVNGHETVWTEKGFCVTLTNYMDVFKPTVEPFVSAG